VEAVVPETVIEVRDLRRRYGEVEAVAGIDLEVRRGEVVALLGPNGAGKTTTIEILEGLRRRDSGRVLVLGSDPSRGDARWRSRIGGVMQAMTAVLELTVEELLRAQAHCYPSPLPVPAVVAAFELEELRDRRVKVLSGGQRRRLDVALAVAGDPEVLFLDEPTTGLDPEVRRRMWDLVRLLVQRGTTIVLTTHYLEEAEMLADRVVILRHGKVVAEGAPEELAARASGRAIVRFRRTGGPAGPLPALAGAGVREEGDRVVIDTDEPTAVVGRLSAWAAANGRAELAELTVSRPNLEDVYISLIGEQQ
jgi:ABC-2 type transport system ATP-binding protein